MNGKYMYKQKETSKILSKDTMWQMYQWRLNEAKSIPQNMEKPFYNQW